MFLIVEVYGVKIKRFQVRFSAEWNSLPLSLDQQKEGGGA